VQPTNVRKDGRLQTIHISRDLIASPTLAMEGEPAVVLVGRSILEIDDDQRQALVHQLGSRHTKAVEGNVAGNIRWRPMYVGVTHS
jgi:hypothetical protein